jgi:hypothetical protein
VAAAGERAGNASSEQDRQLPVCQHVAIAERHLLANERASVQVIGKNCR